MKQQYVRSGTRFTFGREDGNPSFPSYVLLDDHGCNAATFDGASFSEDAVRACVEILKRPESRAVKGAKITTRKLRP